MAFVPEAALIALREGLEALLVTGVLLMLVTRLGHPEARRSIWTGFAAAVATSIFAGWLVHRFLLAPFEERGLGAWFELVAALLAVVTLTYMAFWMWGHTNQVIKQAKKRVKLALATGALATIVFITYISVLREGLETVLFYAALRSQAGWGEILLSGAIGFAVSAVLVVLILTGAKKIGLKPFMTVTGFFLLLVAAMLLTHVVMALIEIGVIGPQRALWDTSHILEDDSALGRILHAVFGYTAAPTLIEAVLYFGYLFTAGGLYLWRVGAFTRRSTEGTRLRRAPVAALAVLLLLVVALVGSAGLNPTGGWITGHDHATDEEEKAHGWSLPADVRLGVLLRNHGSPVEYNATTYQSFAEFTRHLLEMIEMQELLLVDQGTVLMDAKSPFQPGPAVDAELIDAWLGPYDLPAAYVGSPFPEIAQVPLMDDYYVTPGGPGLGEPDILELAGLSAYQAWIQMENHSPMYFDKKVVLDRTIELLSERAGDQVVAATGYHILPYVGPDERIDDALRILMEAGVTHLVDAYTSALHSDVMNGCMMKPHARHAIETAGFTGPVYSPGPSGATHHFAEGIADHVFPLVEEHADEHRIAVFLTHHGLDPEAESPCREGSPDPYNEQAKVLFKRTQEALEKRLERDVLILQVYGQGAEESDRVLSPAQALDEANAWGATHVLDLPYELPGNGFDNLVVHRHSYGFEPKDAPFYGPGYETHLTRSGMQVRILSSAVAAEARAHAQVHAIEKAIEPVLGVADQEEGHGERSSSLTASTRQPASSRADRDWRMAPSITLVGYRPDQRRGGLPVKRFLKKTGRRPSDVHGACRCRPCSARARCPVTRPPWPGG